jgi:hypothetical protein
MKGLSREQVLPVTLASPTLTRSSGGTLVTDRENHENQQIIIGRKKLLLEPKPKHRGSEFPSGHEITGRRVREALIAPVMLLQFVAV